VTLSEDTAASRTGSGPASLATIRAAIIAAIKDAGYLHVPKAGATTPPPPKPSASTASIRTETDIHGTRAGLRGFRLLLGTRAVEQAADAVGDRISERRPGEHRPGNAQAHRTVQLLPAFYV
jgi:hypothetical protein